MTKGKWIDGRLDSWCWGDRAKKGEDYGKTTSPTMRMETFCIVLHVAAAMKWQVHQVDIKTAYLQAWLPPGHHVYMEQPTGFATVGKEDWIWELQKSVYSMPDVGRYWNIEVNKAMVDKFNYTRVPCEHCLYYRNSDTGRSLVGIHVDDFAGAMSSERETYRFKEELKSIWTVKDLGIAKFCLSIAIEHDLARRYIYLSQTALIHKTLAIFKMADCHPVSSLWNPRRHSLASHPHHSPPLKFLNLNPFPIVN